MLRIFLTCLVAAGLMMSAPACKKKEQAPAADAKVKAKKAKTTASTPAPDQPAPKPDAPET